MPCHILPKRPALAPDDRRREVIAIMARCLSAAGFTIASAGRAHHVRMAVDQRRFPVVPPTAHTSPCTAMSRHEPVRH